MGGIYYFVFGVLYSRDTNRHLGEAAGSYPLFLITGIFAWMWTNAAISEAAKALTGQARLITTTERAAGNLPGRPGRGPLRRVRRRPAGAGGHRPVYALTGRIDPGWSLLVLPLAITLQAMLLVGLALLLSALNVLMRDIERFIRLLTRLLFYATPIIYPYSLVRESAAAGLGEVRLRAQPAGRHLPAAPLDLVSGRVPRRPAAADHRAGQRRRPCCSAGGSSVGWSRPY